MEEREGMYNSNLEEDTEFGIHPCVLTGNVYEDNDLFVEVYADGITQMARLAFPFPLFSVVNSAWLSKYADCLVGYLIFQKGLPDRPVLVAVGIKEGKQSQFSDWPNSTTLMSEKFVQVFNDQQNKAWLAFQGKYHIGSEDAEQSAVRGDDLKEQLDALIDQLSALCDGLSALTVITPVGTSSVPVNAATFASVKTQLASIKGKLPGTLSSKTYLE